MEQVQRVADILAGTNSRSENVQNEKPTHTELCRKSQQKMVVNLYHRWGNRDMFIRKFSPEWQEYAGSNPVRAYFGDAPTLARLNIAYGDGTAKMWLIPQLCNVSEYCGCKEKMTGAMLRELAGGIVAEWGYLKVSELMLFFHKFKMGAYGRFYGNVDPMVITCALRDFLADRSLAYDRREKENERQRREAESIGCMTRQEYELMIRDNETEKDNAR